MLLKIDMHVHSHYSYDSLITEKELETYAKKKELDGVAVVDHNRIDGPLKIAKESEMLIVPGQEIDSSGGHIIAFNIQELIPKALSVEETIERIHRAGGLAVACHPAAFVRESLGKDVNADFDSVEVINASAVPFSYSVKHARQLAVRLGASQIAGTDAHIAPEIGYAYTIVNSEPTAEDVIRAIRKGKCTPFGRAIPWSLRLKKLLLTCRKGF